jgi:glycosyltransferase involved in cell wall biosynthesis
MKVVLAVSGTDKYFGMPKYYYMLGNELDKLGIDIELIIDSDRVDLVREFTQVKVTTIKPLAKGFISTVMFCKNLSNYLKTINFDIIHTCHVLPFFYLMERDRKKVIFQPFGNELFTLAGKGLNNTYCKLAQPVLKYCGHKADILLAEGKFQTSDMSRWYKRDDIKILPIGIDITKFKQSIPFDNETFRIISVNSLTNYDRMGLLIEAFRIFYSNYRSSELVIVGKGSEENHLKKQAKDLPVYFLKDVLESDLIDLYAKSDLYVSTSSETDIQMGIIEAMASGLPIVSTGQPYMIDGNGYVTMDNPESVYNGINRVYLGNREVLGINSKALSLQYDFEVIAKKAVKIYEKII